MKITLIIFSKNRAMQLHALLESIQLFAPIYEQIVIIYKATTDDHATAYEKCRNYWQNQTKELQTKVVQFSEQIEFFQTFSSLFGPQSLWTDTSHISMMVDDNLFIKPMTAKDYLIMKNNSDQLFSLRLHPGLHNKKHFDYHYSLDGNIYKSIQLQVHIDDMVKTFAMNPPTNPNELEAILQGNYASDLGRYYQTAYFNYPHLIGVPVNRVSDSSHCAYGEEYPYSEEKLLKDYLDGYVIDVESTISINRISIRDVHCELQFYLRKLNN